MKKLIHTTDTFELYAEVKPVGDLKSLTVTSVWPRARSDKSPHVLFQVTLPPAAIEKLVEVILDENQSS